MLKKASAENVRHRVETPFVSAEVSRVLKAVEMQLGDDQLASSIQFSPTAMTMVKRLLVFGGTIVADTTLITSGVDTQLLGGNGARIVTFINDPNVVQLAEQKRVTRAEIAVDMGLSLPGAKLMVVGSAPAAISRLIRRRQHEPMTDVCVLAAPTGFASVVQLKERLCDSDLASIVVRGKKGGINVTVALLNAIMREIARSANP